MIWSIRLFSMVFLLVIHGIGKPKTLQTCPTAASVDGFWSMLVFWTSLYVMIDMGGCLFCACKLRWFEWLGPRLGCLGRAINAVSMGLAVYSMVLYGRAFTYHIHCVGVVGVFVIICAGTFVLGMLAWWLLIDSDSRRPQSIGDGLGDEEPRCCRSCCRDVCNLFCDTEPWPGPKGRAGPDMETGLPPSPHSATVGQVPPSPSRLGRSSGSGSGDARSVLRVLSRSGEVLYTARTRQAVRTWLKRNLDREKRKGALVEDRPRSKRRKKPPTPGPKGGAVSRTPKPASEV